MCFLPPMEIHYVSELYVDTKDPILRKLVEFCQHNKISIQTREFDPNGYEEDSHYIERLPAIQIYIRSVYQDTIYPDFKPIQFLRLEFDKFQLEELEREAKRQIWEQRIRSMKNMFLFSKTDSKTSNPNK